MSRIIRTKDVAYRNIETASLRWTCYICGGNAVGWHLRDAHFIDFDELSGAGAGDVKPENFKWIVKTRVIR